jgi:hypothetical protein
VTMLPGNPGWSSSLEAYRNDKLLAREMNDCERPARVAAYKVDVSAAFTGRAMRRVVEVDEERKFLAGGDQTLNATLAHYEANFARAVSHIQNNLFMGFSF